MPQENHFLLIGDIGDAPWQQAIKEILASLGVLHIARESEAITLIRQQAYDMIIIDAAKVEDALLLVASIRVYRLDAKVVIATSSPTWRRARDAFRAGATDYIWKSMNREKILATLQAILDKTPPLQKR